MASINGGKNKIDQKYFNLYIKRIHWRKIKMKIKTIITGATGMVGRGVLLECLRNDAVESVLVINRKSVGIKHPKLKEIIHEDFFNLSSLAEELKGYNACYFCLGVSSFRMSEMDYRRITYDLTMDFAKTLLKNNKEMTFCYVSGTGTDSSERGKTMWARVKGKTENDLLNMGFADAYTFRPAYIKPDNDTPSQTPLYKIILPIASVLHPLIKLVFPKYTTTTNAICKAMINVSLEGKENKIIESRYINFFS